MDDPTRPSEPQPDAQRNAQPEARPEPAYRWDATGADPPARPGRAMSRTTERLVWIVGLIGLLFLGVVNARSRGGLTGLTAEGLGFAVGSVIGALAIAFVARWIWTRLRGGRVRSPWVLAVAAVWMLWSIAAGIGR
jgi:hypothetical protein